VIRNELADGTDERDILRASKVITALVGHRVTPPFNFNTTVLERKENDDGRNRDRTRECSGKYVGVFGPPGKETALDVDVEQPRNRDRRPDVGQVVGCLYMFQYEKNNPSEKGRRSPR
jgi:hypothetical protein